ncbi:hypothetical protein DXG01_011769 [Tephrocybe rancida]|nr:hypothetical protein DXG01_011769 [Tephrocybe rancida]
MSAPDAAQLPRERTRHAEAETNFIKDQPLGGWAQTLRGYVDKRFPGFIRESMLWQCKGQYYYDTLVTS